LRIAGQLSLPTWFVILSVNRAFVCWANGWLAIDLRIYRHAAQAWLGGANPWDSSVLGYRFAAPPPTLLPYVPLAIMPEPVAYAISIVVIGGGALLAIRTLRLPFWWILFPPIAESVLVQNPDAALVALLLVPTSAAAFAPLLKIYATIPLLLQGRFRTLLLSAIVVAPSLVLLPAFMARAGQVAFILQDQAASLSAFGTWLFLPAALALVALRGRGTSWLTVPVLWPATQLHYSSLALPVVASRPLLAAAFSLGIPGFAPAAVIAWAAYSGARHRWPLRTPARQPTDAGATETPA
jgi:hypothetical protein